MSTNEVATAEQKEVQRGIKINALRRTLIRNLSVLEDVVIDYADPLFRDQYLKQSPPNNVFRDEIELAFVLRYLLLTNGEPVYSAGTGELERYSDSLNIHFSVNGGWVLSRNGSLSPLLLHDDDLLYDERRSLDENEVQSLFAKVLLFGNPHLLSFPEFKGLSSTSGWTRIINAYKSLPAVKLGNRIYDPVTLQVTRTKAGYINTGSGMYSYETGKIQAHSQQYEGLKHLDYTESSINTSATSNYTSTRPMDGILNEFYKASTFELARNKYLSKEFILNWILREEFLPVLEIFIARFGSEDEALYALSFLSAALTHRVGKNSLTVLGQPNTGKTAIVEWLKQALQENVGTADSDVFVKNQNENFNNKLMVFSLYPVVFLDELPKGKTIDDLTFKQIVNENPQTITIKTKHLDDRKFTMIGKPVIFTNHLLKTDALGIAERNQVVNQNKLLTKLEMVNFNFEADYLAHSSALLTLLMVFGRCWYINRFMGDAWGERDGKKVRIGRTDILEWFRSEDMARSSVGSEEDNPIMTFFEERMTFSAELPVSRSVRVSEAYPEYQEYCKTVLGLTRIPTRQDFITDFCEFILHTPTANYRTSMKSNSGGVLAIPGYTLGLSENAKRIQNFKDANKANK